MRFLIRFSLTIFILFSGCTERELTTHLIEINKLNYQIQQDDWEVITKTTLDDDTYFYLEKRISDTIYSLAFTYFKAKQKYIIDGYTKSYKANSIYHEMALLNNDTLYFFTKPTSGDIIDEGKYIHIDSLNFIMGKYYYIYRMGRLNSRQRLYFDMNMDSLIRIRGNNLPRLPEINE